ncbi:Ethylene-overproduction protein 1 [Vitis vinifera]|uniref:Ethylene-overproduction protein 1 n=1 Tax=Vitis vinifera TaxID=29760 RepID=A0A438G0N2_VITVI|nr:Ethylene-overproduction protein 1 [Vitis vinifera]
MSDTRAPQVHALTPPDANPSSTTSCAATGKVNHHSKWLKLSQAISASVAEPLLPYGLPTTELIEPPIDLHLKSVNHVETLASLYRRLGDPKLLRRCLWTARQNVADIHSKVVLSAWLRYERGRMSFRGQHPWNVVGTFLNVPRQQWYLEINCVRNKIAVLSGPFETMLYGSFIESKRVKIDFSENGISVEGMRAVEVFSRTRRLDSFHPEIVLEMLSFANRFCCEEMKSACDAYLASLVCNIGDALILIDYGLEETASLLVAACLQVLLRELPSSLYNLKVVKIFCSIEAKERLAMVEKWQKALAFHQLGCVRLERKEYEDAECCFEAATEVGHVYSVAGVARAKYKQGHQYSSYELMNSLISDYKSVGWMYQEQSLYCKLLALMEEKQIRASITEIDKIIGFKVSPDCLELRAWFFIALEDYQSALRDIRALLALEPNYIMFHGKVNADHLVELLSRRVQQWSQADCWMQLYNRWSCIDDIGSLAVIHQMLVNDPHKSLLRFRQSLLLLRLNCQKAAMRSLRLAKNHSSSEHERLVYEGWISYDTGHREEALSKAEESIALQRSFEAFFLKAYVLADTSLNPESSAYVIQLLEEALKCPSDGLRKGQALNNLGSIYVDCGKLDLAADCYMNALDIKHTRAHQGLARVCHLKNQRKAAYNEMTKLIDKARNNASAYEKRSEYCDREMAMNDLSMATRLDPLRTYPYRYRAAGAGGGAARNQLLLQEESKVPYKPRNELSLSVVSSRGKRVNWGQYSFLGSYGGDFFWRVVPCCSLCFLAGLSGAFLLMDDQKETEAVEELTKAIAFKPDLQMLHLRAAFYESMGDFISAIQDCEAALCLDPNHTDTLDLYNRARDQATHQQQK